MKPIGSQRFDARCSANGRPGPKTTVGTPYFLSR